MADAHLPPEARLHQSCEFRAAFEKGARYVRPGCVVIVAPGGRNQARLGLAIAKRRIPRAVDRNRVKRVIRESFRCTRVELGTLDVVVLARNGTARMSNRRLSRQLHSVWREVALTRLDGNNADGH